MKFKESTGITGNTMVPAITTKEVVEVPKTEEKIYDQKSYQPDSRYFQSGTGPEAWSSYTYSRNRTMFGMAEAKDLTYTANKEPVATEIYGYYHSSKFYGIFIPGDETAVPPTEDTYENELIGIKGKTYIDIPTNDNFIFDGTSYNAVI